MDKEPLLDLSLMYSVFDTYRERVLAGCPEGFDLLVEVGVAGKVTILFKRDSRWFHASSFYSVKVELLQGLLGRLRGIGWSTRYEIADPE